MKKLFSIIMCAILITGCSSAKEMTTLEMDGQEEVQESEAPSAEPTSTPQFSPKPSATPKPSPDGVMSPEPAKESTPIPTSKPVEKEYQQYTVQEEEL